MIVAEQLLNVDINYMIKALDLVLLLARCEDRVVKMSLCEKEVITKLATLLSCNNEQVLLKVLKIFRYLANEPQL